MQMMQRQLGIVNSRRQAHFLALRAPRSACSARRLDAAAAAAAARPHDAAPRATLPAIVERLKAGYKVVTDGKFAEALEIFSGVFTATALTVVSSRQEVAHLKELQASPRLHHRAQPRAAAQEDERPEARGRARRVLHAHEPAAGAHDARAQERDDRRVQAQELQHRLVLRAQAARAQPAAGDLDAGAQGDPAVRRQPDRRLQARLRRAQPLCHLPHLLRAHLPRLADGALQLLQVGMPAGAQGAGLCGLAEVGLEALGLDENYVLER